MSQQEQFVLSQHTIDCIVLGDLPPSSDTSEVDLPQAPTPNEEEEPVHSLTQLLASHLASDQACYSWLLRKDILKSSIPCPLCSRPMVRLQPDQSHPDGRLYCARCNKRYGGRNGSLFEGTHAKLRNLMHSAIAWFYRYPYQYRVRECGLSARKTDELDILLNVLAYEQLRTNSERIGGPLRVVEIDEALLRRRKYNRGRAKEELWILGGVERPLSATEKPRIFLVPLPDRKQSTIEAVIQEWVEQRSIICTDAFRSYDHLTELGYYHFSVNHSLQFVDPSTDAHTQRIEGLWHQVRREALPMSGAKARDIKFYLAAFLLRKRLGDDVDAFLDVLSGADIEGLRAQLQERQQDSSESPEEEKEEATPHQEKEEPPAPEEEKEEPTLELPQKKRRKKQISKFEENRQHNMEAQMDAHPEAADALRATKFSSPRRRYRNLQSSSSSSAPPSSPRSEIDMPPSLPQTLADPSPFCNSVFSRLEFLSYSPAQQQQMARHMMELGEQLPEARVDLNCPEVDELEEMLLDWEEEDQKTE